jgi:hypothetical protein
MRRRWALARKVGCRTNESGERRGPGTFEHAGNEPNKCGRLQAIKDHLREDIEKVDEPQLKAMFETSAEVLGGLIKAFRDYEQKNESAWRKAS